MADTEIMQAFMQFGVAGLMGMLWTWERMNSRQRERQLDEAHDRLITQHEQLRNLAELIDRNTRTLERFEQTQTALRTLLERQLNPPRNN